MSQTLHWQRLKSFIQTSTILIRLEHLLYLKFAFPLLYFNMKYITTSHQFQPFSITVLRSYHLVRIVLIPVTSISAEMPKIYYQRNTEHGPIHPSKIWTVSFIDWLGQTIFDNLHSVYSWKLRTMPFFARSPAQMQLR